jgi:hypothetical protein
MRGIPEKTTIKTINGSCNNNKHPVELDRLCFISSVKIMNEKELT